MSDPRQRTPHDRTQQSVTVMGVTAVVLGAVALVTAWVPQKLIVVFALAVSAFVLGTIEMWRAVRRRTATPVIAQLGILLGTLACIAVPGGLVDGGHRSTPDGDENYRMEAAPQGPPTTGSSAPSELRVEITEGTWVVGEDIAPGKYRTGGPVEGEFGFCTWERLEDLSTEGPPVITGNMVAEPVTVKIDPADGAFETNGCQPWVRVGS